MKNIKQSIAIIIVSAILITFGAMSVYAATYSETPGQVVCTPHGDLKTEVGFNWVTNIATTGNTIQLRVKGSGIDFSQGIQFTGTNTEVSSVGTFRWHKVEAIGLQPGTKYEYRVGDGSVWSAIGEFETAPSVDPSSFTFLQLNDPQASSAGTWQNSLSRASTRFPGYKFILMGGDHVDKANNEDQWVQYFNEGQAIQSKTILASATGNHDSGNSYFANRFNYKNLTSETTSGVYYSFDYANAHFTVLNSESITAMQTNWAKYDIVKNSKKWNLIMIHQPLYTNADHYKDNAAVTNNWSAVLNDVLEVDLIFGGHDHTYNRTYPIKNLSPMPNSDKLNNVLVGGSVVKELWVNPTGTLNILNNTAGLKYYNQNANADTSLFAYALQPGKPSFAGVMVTENEIINTAYYVNGTSDTLIERHGIRKDLPQVQAPQNIKRTFANNRMTLTWDAPNNSSVRGYVVYDDNNAYTTSFATFFTDATTRTYQIPMTQATYEQTNFVVKALGSHSYSEIGQPASVGGASISGSVGFLSGWYFNNPDNDPVMTAFQNQFGSASIKLYDASFQNVVAETTAAVNANPDGQDTLSVPFKLEAIADGTYYLEISRGGMCPKVSVVTISGADVDLGQQVLLPTDLNGDYQISVVDVNMAIAILKQGGIMYSEENYSFILDVNGDGIITVSDINAIIAALKNSSNYQNW